MGLSSWLLGLVCEEHEEQGEEHEEQVEEHEEQVEEYEY